MSRSAPGTPDPGAGSSPRGTVPPDGRAFAPGSPDLAAGGDRAGSGAARIAACSLVVRYPGSAPDARPALELDALEVSPGTGVALVGESGSGKTTALRALLGVVRPTSGSVEFDGVPLDRLRGGALRTFRRAAQPIQQDVDGALDPRQSIGSAIAEGYRAGGGRQAPAGAAVTRLLDEVGLPAALAHRHPHEVSGGQRQRAVIARALAVEPRILLLDEPTSGLDATVQVRILELLERLREERGLGILLVSHNLGVVARLCSETLVLYRGEVVERGDTRLLLQAPRHPYTAALRRSVPEIGVPFRAPYTPSDEARRIDTASGCRFASRCPHALVATCAPVQRLEPAPGDHSRLVRCARTAELGRLDPLS